MNIKSVLRPLYRLSLQLLTSPFLLFTQSVKTKNTLLHRCSLKNQGRQNTIIINNAVLEDCSFVLLGNNLQVILDGGVFHHVQFWLEDTDSLIHIGKDTTIEGAHIAAIEGHSVTIGKDCMLSEDVVITNSDSHSILSNNIRINPAKDVKIGDHCWLGRRVTVLKGVIIPDNCVIGTNSTVTKSPESPASIYAGSPAKLVRQGVSWKRERN